MQPLQPRKTARRVEMRLDRLEISPVVEPMHDLAGAQHARKPNDRPPRHPVIRHRCRDAAIFERATAAVGARYQAALGRRHRDVNGPTVEVERTDHADRDGHVTDDVLATGTHDELIVVVLVGQVGESGPQVGRLLADDLAADFDAAKRIVEDLFQLVRGDVFGVDELDDLFVDEGGEALIGGVHDPEALRHVAEDTFVALQRNERIIAEEQQIISKEQQIICRGTANNCKGTANNCRRTANNLQKNSE